MPRKNSSLLKNLSTSDLKNLLAARERIDVLEVEKVRLTKELAKVDKELDRLLAGTAPGKPPARSKTTRKKAAKKVARGKAAKGKPSAGKKDVGKKVAKQAAKKKVARKKAAKKTVRKKASAAERAARTKTGGRVKSVTKAGTSRMKLEDVVASVIRKHGAPVSFQDIMAAIVKGKLFATRSSNFDNVLRRTLSTSKMIKRVGRGIYDVA